MSTAKTQNAEGISTSRINLYGTIRNVSLSHEFDVLRDYIANAQASGKKPHIVAHSGLSAKESAEESAVILKELARDTGSEITQFGLDMPPLDQIYSHLLERIENGNKSEIRSMLFAIAFFSNAYSYFNAGRGDTIVEKLKGIMSSGDENNVYFVLLDPEPVLYKPGGFLALDAGDVEVVNEGTFIAARKAYEIRNAVVREYKSGIPKAFKESEAIKQLQGEKRDPEAASKYYLEIFTGRRIQVGQRLVGLATRQYVLDMLLLNSPVINGEQEATHDKVLSAYGAACDFAMRIKEYLPLTSAVRYIETLSGAKAGE